MSEDARSAVVPKLMGKVMAHRSPGGGLSRFACWCFVGLLLSGW